jgi:hypothetical protein
MRTQRPLSLVLTALYVLPWAGAECPLDPRHKHAHIRAVATCDQISSPDLMQHHLRPPRGLFPRSIVAGCCAVCGRPSTSDGSTFQDCAWTHLGLSFPKMMHLGRVPAAVVCRVISHALSCHQPIESTRARKANRMIRKDGKQAQRT